MFEYRQITITNHDAPRTDEILSEWGQGGWHVIDVRHMAFASIYLLERRNGG